MNLESTSIKADYSGFPKDYEVDGQLSIYDWLWDLGGYMNPPEEDTCSKKIGNVGTAKDFGNARAGRKE